MLHMLQCNKMLFVVVL